MTGGEGYCFCIDSGIIAPCWRATEECGAVEG